MTPYPSSRSVRHALDVLARLPLEAVADLVERLVDKLDAAEPDPDLEPETDRCDSEDMPYAGPLRAFPDLPPSVNTLALLVRSRVDSSD